jgi:diguanylate cyclase (GGDEF)-like protein
MARVVGCITQHHDLGLVALACLVCILATRACTHLMLNRPCNEAPQRTIRLGGAILTFSVGVWATHFIGILAYRPGALFGYYVPLCVLSLVLVTGATTVAFTLGQRENASVTIDIARGLVLGSGVALMHLVGVLAVMVPGRFHFQAGIVAASLAIGVACAIGAMALLTRQRPAMASLLLTFMVISIHFIATTSVTLEPVTGIAVPSLGISQLALAIAAGGASVLIVILALAASILDQHHNSRLAKEARRFRTLADATSEGIVFERNGRIADVNRAMSRLAGSEAVILIGLRLVDLIPGITLAPDGAEQPEEHVVVLPDGQTRPVEIQWRHDPDHAGHVLAIRDLSQQKAAESQIDRLVRFDPLTGLGNRTMFKQQLQKAMTLADREARGVALLNIDLDRFETIEAAGPRAREQILMQAAARLNDIVRESDTIARLGRDEFSIVQLLNGDPSEAAALADRIVAEMASPFTVDDQPFALAANIGIALYPADGDCIADLIKSAAQARRYARHNGHGWRCFEPRMDLLLQAKRSLERDLLIAVEQNQFCLHYQPFIAIQTQELAGYEALLRWDHPERGRIPPSDFIPLAEECGLIVPIGKWALATACAEAASWDDPVTISVNLSPAQFVQPGIVTTVADVLHQSGLPPARLELEITEGTLMDDAQTALHTLTALKALGVRIAMDDFGTGYSSLSYLRKFPFDKIKIDRTFISEAGDDAEAETIVQAIIALGRSLRLDVTAEGVETRQQLAMLRGHGCTFAQGYLLGRPHAADQLGQHIAKDWPVFGDVAEPHLATSETTSSAG